MEAKPIVDMMVDLLDGDEALVAQHGPRALALAIRRELVPHLEKIDLTRQAWQLFQQSPRENSEQLSMSLGLLLGADTALSQRLEALYAEFHGASGQGASTTISTGSGSIARDQTIHGDDVD